MLITNLDSYLKVRKGAIHVGAHEGQERHWYKNNSFEKVIWFEPNTEIFPRLVENIRDFSGQQAFNLGVHESLTNAVLHISSNGGQSSSILEFGLHKHYAPTINYIRQQKIKLVRIDKFLIEHQFDISEFNFLNVDVQGVELSVMKSFGELLGKLDYIYAEVNTGELYKGCCLLSEIDEYVSKFGFIRVLTKMTQCEWGDAFYRKTR